MSRNVKSVPLHRHYIICKDGRRKTNCRIEGMGAKAMVDNGDSSKCLILYWGGSSFVEGAFAARGRQECWFWQGYQQLS